MSDFISLRTVLVVVCNDNIRMTVNALLDDASTKKYINNDVAEQLELKGIPKQVRVNVLNNQVRTFKTLPVEFNLESVNGKIKDRVSAYTVDRVTGKMKLINWKKYKDKWKHLEGLNFPALGRRPIVDILIGMGYA